MIVPPTPPSIRASSSEFAFPPAPRPSSLHFVNSFTNFLTHQLQPPLSIHVAPSFALLLRTLHTSGESRAGIFKLVCGTTPGSSFVTRVQLEQCLAWLQSTTTRGGVVPIILISDDVPSAAAAVEVSVSASTVSGKSAGGTSDDPDLDLAFQLDDFVKKEGEVSSGTGIAISQDPKREIDKEYPLTPYVRSFMMPPQDPDEVIIPTKKDVPFLMALLRSRKRKRRRKRNGETSVGSVLDCGPSQKRRRVSDGRAKEVRVTQARNSRRKKRQRRRKKRKRSRRTIPATKEEPFFSSILAAAEQMVVSVVNPTVSTRRKKKKVKRIVRSAREQRIVVVVKQEVDD